MNFDSIKKNKPILIDYNYLNNYKKPQINIDIEPTIYDKIITKIKLNTYLFIENNIYIIVALIILIILLIYRYIQYQHYKNRYCIHNLH